MTTKPYDSKRHTVYLTTHDDIVFPAQGKGEGGNFILITFDTDSVSKEEGVDGDIQYSIRVAESASWSVGNQWGSDFNAIMNKIFASQKEGNYLKKIELKRITPVENISVCVGERPMVIKVPDYSLGAKPADRVWMIATEHTKFNEQQVPA